MVMFFSSVIQKELNEEFIYIDIFPFFWSPNRTEIYANFFPFYEALVSVYRTKG